MSFIDTIKADMYTAMKSGEKKTTGTLRTLLSKLKDQQINMGKKLSSQLENSEKSLDDFF